MISRRPPFTAIAWLPLVLSACTGPSLIDEKCIKGRLSAEQAAAINAAPWGHLPLYNEGADGQCKHCAKEHDRVLSAGCSQFIKNNL